MGIILNPRGTAGSGKTELVLLPANIRFSAESEQDGETADCEKESLGGDRRTQLSVVNSCLPTPIALKHST